MWVEVGWTSGILSFCLSSRIVLGTYYFIVGQKVQSHFEPLWEARGEGTREFFFLLQETQSFRYSLSPGNGIATFLVRVWKSG